MFSKKTKLCYNKLMNFFTKTKNTQNISILRREKCRRQFIKHLKSVCKDKTIRMYALKYYNDLIKFRENVTYSSDDFDTITLNGEIVQQDVVNALMSNGNRATIDEIFTYLFKQNVNKISIIELERDGLRITQGLYNIYTKDIKIAPKKINLQVISHELNHVLETHCFSNGAIFYYGLESNKFVEYNRLYKNAFLKNNTDNLISCQNRCISSDIISQELKLSYDHHSPYYLKKRSIANGAKALNEIMNECLTQIINNTLNLNTPEFSVFPETGISECVLSGSNAIYQEDFGIMTAFLIASRPKDWMNIKFSPQKVIDNFNMQTISTEKAQYFVSELENIGSVLGSVFEMHDIIENTAKTNAYNFLCIILGMKRTFSDLKKSDYPEKYDIMLELKLLAQATIFENIARRIDNELNNDEIVKNDEYFLSLDEIIDILTSVILYPMGTKICSEQILRRENINTEVFVNSILNTIIVYIEKRPDKEKIYKLMPCVTAIKNEYDNAVMQSMKNYDDVNQQDTSFENIKEL